MPRREHGPDDEWRAILDSFFTDIDNLEPQKEYWNPYEIFVSNEEVRKFFNGHEMPEGRDKLDYREKFAKWAIGEALKDYPGAVLDPAGDDFTTKSVRYPLGNTKKASRADKDDKSQPSLESKTSNPTSGQNDKPEVVQDLYGAAQALFYASPNCLGPPIYPAALYLQMKKVGKHGQSGLSLYNSPLFPEVEYRIEKNEPQPEAAIARHTGLFHVSGNSHQRPAAPDPRPARLKPSKGFLDSQVTGITWILSRLLGKLPKLQRLESARERDNRERLRGPKYGGAILADSMGLGKTLTAIASIELLASHRLNVQYAEGTNLPVYRPILILCPNVSVTAQWVEEILQNTSPKSIVRILVGGGDAGLFAQDDRVSYLSIYSFTHWPGNHSGVWDENNPNAAKTVILCPLDTWAQRTVYTQKDEEGKTTWHSRFTEDDRQFSLICVDEAHRVKNRRTRLHKSVELLERQFMLLITATPCTNSLGDMHGLVELLWSSASKQIDSVEEVKDAYENIDDLEEFEGIITDVPSHHDLQLIAACPSLLKRLMRTYHNGRGQDIGRTRRYLHFFETLAMIKRGPGSFIFEDFEQTKRIPLEGLYPGVNSRTVNIDFDEATATGYQSVHLDLLVQYLKAVKYWPAEEEEEEEGGAEDAAAEDKSEKSANVTQLYRRWQIAASSMDVYKLETLFTLNGFGPDTEPVSAMRRANRTFIQLAEFLLEGDDPTPNTALDYLKLAIKSSPVLRYILHDLKEHVLSQRVGTKIKKLLITENIPILAYYYELVLQFIGINCRVLHADLGESERKRLIADFNSDRWESTQVLIQMYTVGFAGTNLHKNCSRVIVAAQAHSLAVQWQAIHRVIRVGQTENVDVIRVKIPNSYHAFLEGQQTEKILPELSARVQGPASHILVQLLNDFQDEVSEAWSIYEQQKSLESAGDSPCPMPNQLPIPSANKRPEAASGDGMSSTEDRAKRQFESTGDTHDVMSLETDLEEKDDTVSENKTVKDESSSDGPPSKRRKLNLGQSKALLMKVTSLKREDQVDDNDAEGIDSEISIRSTPANTTMHTSHRDGSVQSLQNAPPATSPHVALENVDVYPAMRTRVEYFREFRQLPETRGHFDHHKHRLRRLLQFRKVGDDGQTLAPWTMEDLEQPAVLERGLELILRVISGAGHIELVPIPQIDMSRVPRDILYYLMSIVADFTQAVQPLALAEEHAEEMEAEEEEDDGGPEEDHETHDGGDNNDEHGEDPADEGHDHDDDDVIILDDAPLTNPWFGISRRFNPSIIGDDPSVASSIKDEGTKTEVPNDVTNMKPSNGKENSILKSVEKSVKSEETDYTQPPIPSIETPDLECEDPKESETREPPLFGTPASGPKSSLERPSKIGKGRQNKVKKNKGVRIKQESPLGSQSDDSNIRNWLNDLPHRDDIGGKSIKKDSGTTGALAIKKEPDTKGAPDIKEEPTDHDSKSMQGAEDGPKKPVAKKAGSQQQPIVIDGESQAGGHNDEGDDDDVQFVSETRRPSRNDDAVQFIRENRIDRRNDVRTNDED